MDDELMECQREKERLEEDLSMCQREIRRLRDVIRHCDWERRQLEEFIQNKIQEGGFSDDVVRNLQEVHDCMQELGKE